MAKYKVEYDLEGDKVTKTLTFMGKEYSEVWKENASFCACGLEGPIEDEYPDLPEDVSEAIRNIGIGFSGDDEIMEYLETLTTYEHSQV